MCVFTPMNFNYIKCKGIIIDLDLILYPFYHNRSFIFIFKINI